MFLKPFVCCLDASAVYDLLCQFCSYIITSNKKHFMKNVKECRDVNRQKSIRTKCKVIVTHHTHFGPIASSESSERYEVQRVCAVLL